ncbi:MAG TPA: histidine kinase [Natronosporangium sp.]
MTSWRGWFTVEGGGRARVADGLLAGLVAAVQLVGTYAYSRDEPSPWPLDGYAYLLLATGPAALLARRRWPVATLAVALLAAAGYAASGYPRGPAGVPAFLLALVNAIMMGRRRSGWAAVAVGMVAFGWLPLLMLDAEERVSRSVDDVFWRVGWLPLVAALAELARSHRERRAEQARVEREAARRRASEERLLIARELHDVLAHNISLINVQSGVALHLLDQQPEQARPALRAINEASEAALAELQSVLDVLNRGIGDDGAPRSPTAGLADLDELVRRTRAAGVEVRLTVEGEPCSLPPGVDLAAFRIAQEALTNVVRHAGAGATATLQLAYAPAAFTVQVDDDGPGGNGAAGNGTTGGRGIAGMRQRVTALDGTFDAGPRPGRGFRVRARFPTRDEAR